MGHFWTSPSLSYVHPLNMFTIAAAFLFVSPLLVGAQLQFPTCSSQWSWASNSVEQTPCAVAAALQGVCNSGAFVIPSLDLNDSYIGPTGPDDASDTCKCSTVVYSLMSACSACQGGLWFNWKTFSDNCDNVDAPGTFSKGIPEGTLVPEWAFLDVTQSQYWNPVLSYQVGDNVEVGSNQTGALVRPSPTTTQTAVPGLSSLQAQFVSNVFSHKKAKNTVGIVLGILSGIVVTAVVVALWLWRTRVKRRKMTRTAASVIFANRAFPLQEKGARDRYEPRDVFQEAI